MIRGQAKFQIGKNGLTENFIETLKSAFSIRKSVKIHVLKSAGHTKENVEKIAENITNKLGRKYRYKIVGFSIFIKR